jgi:3-oxochol-4-en-24-oyl-CoA dehydrogenase
MNLALSEEQSLLKNSFEHLFAAESGMDRVRAALPTGFDPLLWQLLSDNGIPIARVSNRRGGLDLSLLDAAIIAEVAGSNLASAPVIEAMIGAAIASECCTDDVLLDDVFAGRKIIVPMIEQSCKGCASIVPGGSVADGVIGFDGESLFLSMVSIRLPACDTIGCVPAGRFDIAEHAAGSTTILATGEAARERWESAIEEWHILTAASLGGQAKRALQLAAQYGIERTQFGRPIGSFQAIAHPLADSLTDVEAGQLLVWKTIAAIAKGDDRAGALISLAWWWMAKSAATAARCAMRTLGGYGLSLEYDLQLYNRRINTAILLGGDPARALSSAGDRLFGRQITALPVAGEVGISFGFDEEALAFAEEVRRFFADTLTEAMMAKGHHSSKSHDPVVHRKLAEAGFIFADWPTPPLGAKKRRAIDMQASAEVFEDVNYTSFMVATTDIVGRIVERYGSERAKQEALTAITRGEAICALGFTEPHSGSDVFAARTSAVRDGDTWIINGQKMFTTGGHLADYVFLLARTDSSGAKHEGLTLFLVPTKLPGYSCQAVETYQDERTNITFYTDMAVPDYFRLGEAGQGARVMAAALSIEHGGANLLTGQTRMVQAGLQWAHDKGADGSAPIDRPDIRQRLAAVTARYEAADCLAMRSIWAADAGVHDRSWGPMAKMFVTDSYLSNAWEMLEMAAPESILVGKHPLGVVELGHRRAYGTTIYGGTNEIHRSLIAEQALALPKSRS